MLRYAHVGFVDAYCRVPVITFLLVRKPGITINDYIASRRNHSPKGNTRILIGRRENSFDIGNIEIIGFIWIFLTPTKGIYAVMRQYHIKPQILPWSNNHQQLSLGRFYRFLIDFQHLLNALMFRLYFRKSL